MGDVKEEVLLQANLLLLFVMKQCGRQLQNIGFGFDNDGMQFLCCEIWPLLPQLIN